MEFQLVDPRTGDLVDGILPLLEVCDDHESIQPEFIQNTVEVISPPAADITELAASLRSRLHELQDACGRVNLAVCGAGTHPFCSRPAVISPGPRYARLEKVSGWLSHNQVTFATHVHLGMPGGEEAVRLLRELKPFLPLLIALSASSPFWHGEDTRFAAFRHRVLASARSYGPPPDFEDWSGFEHFFETMQRAGMLRAINDLHWDLRPRPDLGTIEVRVMDAQPTLAEALSFVALLRALIRFLRHTRGGGERRRPLRPLFWWYLKENCFAASRYGLDARLIVTDEGDVRPLAAVARELLERIAPHAADDETPHLRRLAEALPGGLPYQRVRRVLAASGSLEAVVRALTEELRAEGAVASCR
ncbi:MAG: YbdK family carboxylate-amine ligase [Synechococcaceae cyanobacterium]|nr:YbdK family carboxylate-amine ligase [Synechococcaceae cyanobacterium]